MANGVWAWVQNRTQDPQANARFRSDGGWIGRVIDYTEQGYQGWYWVETQPNIDLTCYLTAGSVESTATHNTDNLLFPEGVDPGERHLTFTMPPFVFGPGPVTPGGIWG